MKLIVILICVGLLRYAHFGHSLERYSWLQRYATTLCGYIKGLHESWLLTLIVLLPILVIAAFLQITLFHDIFYFFGFFYSIFILWYCLWPVSLETQLETQIQHALATNTAQDSRPFSTALLVDANSQVFAVLFWYMILGPFGAILYRLVAELARVEGSLENIALLAKAAAILQAILDWVPARLVTLGYIVCGNFATGLVLWRHYILSGINSSRELLIAAGLGAMNLTPAVAGDLEEARQTLKMIERALIAWLVIIAIFTLGHWM